MPRLGLGLGLAKGSVLPTIDAEALALYNRVIADGGIVPAGLAGMDAYIKSAKAARGISTLAQGYLSLAHPHYTGIRLATGTGATAGNRAARTVYNAIGATGDFIQTTAANQPLGLVHSGTNYAWLPGVAGNFFSTPNAAGNQITGDLEIIIDCNLPNFAPTGDEQWLLSKYGYSENNRCYSFGFSTGLPRLVLRISTDGTSGTLTTITATSNCTLSPNSNGFLKVTYDQNNGSGQYEVKFWQSTNRLTWVQIGATITGASISNTFTGAAPVLVGAIGSLSTNTGVVNGIISRATISNSIDGTPTQIFNPASYNRATSQTSWTSSTGEVWTLNTPATNNALKAAIVDTTMVMGNGTSYGMQASSLNMNQSAITSYTAFRKYVNAAGTQVINELGANATTNAGKALYLNTVTNQEDVWLFANVGGYNSRFTSTNLGLKLATAVNNIANANESSPYLINNSSQSFVASDVANNNTANMNSTGYNLLARNNASSLWANAFIVADCVTIGEDNTTQQTSMYNFFKTYINGI